MAERGKGELFQTRTVLAKGIQVIVFMFAAFSGFFRWVAPPAEVQARFAAGFGSFLALGFLLLIVALAARRQPERSWTAWLAAFAILFAVGVWSGVRYWGHRTEYSFPYPPEETVPSVVGGVTMLAEAEKTMREKNFGKSELLEYYGPQDIHQIWTPESIRQAERILLLEYVAFVVTLSSALFCITEGILGRPEVGLSRHKPRKAKPKRKESVVADRRRTP